MTTITFHNVTFQFDVLSGGDVSVQMRTILRRANAALRREFRFENPMILPVHDTVVRAREGEGEASIIHVGVITESNMSPRKRKPSEWEKHFGIRVIDPDGWNRQARDWDKEWNTPLTEDEFLRKADVSTTCPTDTERCRRYYHNRRR